MGADIAAVVSAIGGVLVGLAGVIFGFLGKREERTRAGAEQDAKDVVSLTEQKDELERRLDVVLGAYWDQRDAVRAAGHGALLLAPPAEMARTVKP